MLNCMQFAGRSFLCVNLVPQGPSYATVPDIHKQCPVVGAEAGATLVEGSNYIQQSFRYSPENKWKYESLPLQQFTC